MRKIFGKQVLAAIAGLSLLFVPAVAFASNTPTLDQTINQGTLTTNILQADDSTPVASPTVAFPATNVSFACQTETATLGNGTNKVNVTNLATNNGWTLTMAATGGNTTPWTDGTDTYKYNDATGSGCTNGQLTVDASVATLTDDCSGSCSDTDVTKGTSTAFVSGSADNITLLTDSDGSPWEGYLTGIGLSQKIPASQHAGSYTLGMTLTVTAD
jgi:hypothetical protein